MTARRLVAGVDSSTQSCKVVIRDADSGELLRQGRASHPEGTEVDPRAWERALREAVDAAGGLTDVAAISIAGQQHGMVLLDESDEIIRPALLWNDTRSAAAASELVDELGAQAWSDGVGTVPVASLTVTKLRWVAHHEPTNAARAKTVVLPHDWLTNRLMSEGSAFTTDRGDASGTGYWSPTEGRYRLDLLAHAFGRELEVPKVLGPVGVAGTVSGSWGAATDVIIGCGSGDNMGAALGLGALPGTVIVSLGTSGTAFAVSETPTSDSSGAVAGFADATGRFLPLVCTLNAALVLSTFGTILGVDHVGFDRLALEATAGAGGVSLLPYLAGERTPNRPAATGELAGLNLSNSTPANIARAAVEGMLCGMADAIDALTAQGVPIERIVLIGGASQSLAVQQIAPAIFGRPVFVASPGEYVADGAARQAAKALGADQHWPDASGFWVEAAATPHVRAAYAALRDR
ncbi:MAG: xylulokinase [Actinomycetes bacterium]